MEALQWLSTIARDLEFDYFVVGAMARQIILNGVFGLVTDRATHDMDFGVVVSGWSQFEAIKACLVASGAFEPDKTRAHRLQPSSGRRGYPLDLIPFGGVEQPQTTIAWPPDGSVLMNVAGYGEALTAAVLVEVAPGIVVRVASLPGLALMKLVAWADRGVNDPRDAIDLATLLRTYHDAGNEDRLYGAEIDLAVMDFDVELGGARLLGMDAGRIAAPTTRRQILVLVNESAWTRRLVRDVARGLTGTDPIAEATELLAQFKSGFEAAA